MTELVGKNSAENPQGARTRSGLLAIVLTGALVAGCAGSGPERQPVDPLAAVADTNPPVTTPAPDGRTFDADGNPYVPGTSRLLERTFYFDYDRSVLRQDDLASLQMHARILKENPNRSVTIEGHADERGSREYNLALGERRAGSVRSFLVTAGVSPRQIETVSYGEERPQDPGHDEGAWSRNRRAAMIYRQDAPRLALD